MRLLEALLLGAILLSLMVLSAPRLRDGPWLRLATGIALLIAVAQAWLEGPRWQVVPADVLAAVLFALALRRSAATMRPRRTADTPRSAPRSPSTPS